MNPGERHISAFDGYLWLFPGLASGERMEVQWSGVRQRWTDSTVMPWVDADGVFDQDVRELLEYGLHWRSAAFDNNDSALAAQYRALYRGKLAEIIANSAKRDQLNVPNIGAVECSV